MCVKTMERKQGQHTDFAVVFHLTLKERKLFINLKKTLYSSSSCKLNLSHLYKSLQWLSHITVRVKPVKTESFGRGKKNPSILAGVIVWHSLRWDHEIHRCLNENVSILIHIYLIYQTK